MTVFSPVKKLAVDVEVDQISVPRSVFRSFGGPGDTQTSTPSIRATVDVEVGALNGTGTFALIQAFVNWQSVPASSVTRLTLNRNQIDEIGGSIIGPTFVLEDLSLGTAGAANRLIVRPDNLVDGDIVRYRLFASASLASTVSTDGMVVQLIQR